ncbi:MAG: outer membrane protein assembly factor BamE [Variovorax sp.]|nr:MAG: outer membrane protein assembly factor BamE [Variovorax sp.]
MTTKNRFSAARSASQGLRLTLAAVTVALLAGCAASPSHTLTPEAQARAASNPSAVPGPDDFPALDTAKWPQGSFPSVEALRAMRTGMGKDQVRELLSWPHFSEGLFGVREWNYIFHFRTGKGPEFTTCQYMVRFNGDVLTNGVHWKTAACAALIEPAVTRLAAPATLAAPRKLSLAADGLFRFDGSAWADLLPDGQRRVEALATELKDPSAQVKGIVVTGHTDRIGSARYNDTLSLARANTVRDVLVRQGVDAKLIRTAGDGLRQPVVTCEGTQATPALVSCLQPNRRVDIEVSAAQ